MDVLDASNRQADRSTHADDLVALESVAALNGDAATFEAWLRATLQQEQPSGPAVLLSTVHRVKGREWGHVVVYGLSQGILPHRLSQDDEGERRVLHVALTRARTQVVAVADIDVPSSFLAELERDMPPRTARAGSAEGRPEQRASRSHHVATGRQRAAPPGEAASHRHGAAPGSAEEALRAWRRDVAARSGVPAYVVLNDAELSGVAQAQPTTLSELGACRGMGPIRLERWGDEILAILDARTSA
jgi:DNA helicase-2/ATP-dependent DNA helicase PcrA